MTTDFAKSGITSVGDIPWGTHFSHFYESEDDLPETLVPYFKAGLESNEFCLWVISRPLTLAKVRSALRQAITDFDRYMAERSIEILPHNRLYLAKGAFDPGTAVNLLNEKVDEALARGYVGVRAANSAAWAGKKHQKDLDTFEKELNESIASQRVTMLCSYPLAASRAAEILDTARTHHFVVARRQGDWEVVQTLGHKQGMEQISTLNGEPEQGVIKRTKGPTAANKEPRAEITERKRADEHLQLRADVLDQIQAAVITIDLQGVITYWNRYAEELYGWRREEVVGRPKRDLIVGPSELGSAAEIGKRIQGEGSWEGEFTARRKDGSSFPAYVIDTLIRDAQGQSIGIASVYLDLTKRKEIESEVSKQKEILQKIVDHIPVMIRFYGEDGRLKLANREWERTLGWSLEEIQEQNLDIYAECYPDPRDREYVMNFIVAATGKSADFKTRVRDGRVIDTSWTNIRLSDGTTMGIGQDITERKRAENAAREHGALAEVLHDTAAALNSTLDFEEVLQRILENVGRVVPHDTSVILLSEGSYLHIAGHRGFAERGLAEWIEGFRIAIDKHPGFRQVVETGTPLLLSEVPSTPGFEEVAPELRWVRSYITAPIRIRGEIIGSLNLHSSVPGFFTPFNAIGLQAFADQAGIALENARLLQEVQAARERLRILSNQLIIAQEAERRAIARELHDEIGQVLTAVGAHLRVIELSPIRMTRAERLQESLKLVDDALKQVRDLALDLRPSLLDDFGLVPALEWYVDRQAQRSGFKAKFVANPPEMRLSPSLETTCFRVAQIALANVARHAHAKHVWVELNLHETDLELVIRDNGVGFDVQTALGQALRGSTFGLLSMQERVWLARGEIEVKSAPGRGTEIRARFLVD